MSNAQEKKGSSVSEEHDDVESDENNGQAVTMMPKLLAIPDPMVRSSACWVRISGSRFFVAGFAASCQASSKGFAKIATGVCKIRGEIF